ncbi:MAG: UDP-N-acetylmuramate dehydrogenase [Candidatus Gracilibacteria bacterium]
MEIQKNHLLAPYSTYQIGGNADYFLEANTAQEVVDGLKFAKEDGLKVVVFGGGSNILFDDSGFRGLVVRVRSSGLHVEGERIFADAGVSMAKLVKLAEESSLTGLEAWNGLPGTVGGAVRGNAGCFGTEIKDVLEKATLYMPEEKSASLQVGESARAKIKEVTKDFLDYGYRSSFVKSHPGVIVLSAVFLLKKGDSQEIHKKMMETAKNRILKQPAGPSTGSFFKNPEGASAGKLIEDCGLKGKIIGKAQISPMHANFFMNLGGANSKDIIALAELAESQVKEKFGITLEREVAVIENA